MINSRLSFFTLLFLLFLAEVTLAEVILRETHFKPVGKDGVPLSFPKDHGEHEGYKQEWWYLTSNLIGQNNRSYGVQFTLFSASNVIDKNKHKFYFAHAALSSSDRFHHAERYARSDMQHAGVHSKPWRAYIDHWVFSGSGQSPLPGTLEVSEKDFGYALELSDADYFLQGEEGYSVKDKAGILASYYYNAPFIKVEGHIREGKEIVKVTGWAWLDREWSSELSFDSNIGWDWFALRIDKNQSLMIYRVRTQKKNEHIYARLMNKSGQQITINEKDLKLIPLEEREFKGKNYTIKWKIEIPTIDLSITTSPLNKNQFLDTLIPYWEGAVEFSGTHTGTGYMELFGDR